MPLVLLVVVGPLLIALVGILLIAAVSAVAFVVG